jgi:hypothetical protein
LAVVSTCREAYAGKEKLAGARLKYVGIEEFQLPVAAASGVVPLNKNEGTRGIMMPSKTPILDHYALRKKKVEKEMTTLTHSRFRTS